MKCADNEQRTPPRLDLSANPQRSLRLCVVFCLCDSRQLEPPGKDSASVSPVPRPIAGRSRSQILRLHLLPQLDRRTHHAPHENRPPRMHGLPWRQRLYFDCTKRRAELSRIQFRQGKSPRPAPRSAVQKSLSPSRPHLHEVPFGLPPTTPT